MVSTLCEGIDVIENGSWCVSCLVGLIASCEKVSVGCLIRFVFSVCSLHQAPKRGALCAGRRRRLGRLSAALSLCLGVRRHFGSALRVWRVRAARGLRAPGGRGTCDQMRAPKVYHQLRNISITRHFHLCTDTENTPARLSAIFYHIFRRTCQHCSQSPVFDALLLDSSGHLGGRSLTASARAR